MSDEYINREDALDIVAHNNVNGEITLNRYDKIIDGIYEIPSADVAPIRRGHWIFNQEDMTLHCSCCDEVFRFEEDEKDECLDFMEYAKYCLACGAVMDEEVD